MIVADFGLLLLLSLMESSNEDEEENDDNSNPISFFMNLFTGESEESSKPEDQGDSMLLGLLLVVAEIIWGVVGYLIGVEKMESAFLAGKAGKDYLIALARLKKSKFYYQMAIIFGVTSSIFSTVASLLFGNIYHMYLTDNEFDQMDKDSATNYAISGAIFSFIAGISLFAAFRCTKESAAEKYQPKIPKYISYGITIFGAVSWLISLLLGAGSLFIILT